MLQVAPPLLLALGTFALYSGCLTHEFLNWDDELHIHSNPDVQQMDLRGMLTSSRNAVYHPLTDLSWALEHRAVGLAPFLFHLDNVLLHVLNVLLVVALLRRLLPGPPELALAGGALFAVHPLQVETVAWVTSRKDLLMVAFLLAGLLLHLRHRRRRTAGRYAAVFACFALALLSKPSAATFPALLVAVDLCLDRGLHRRLLLEKLPLLAVSGLSIARSRAVHEVNLDLDFLRLYTMDPAERILIAAQSIVFYVSKFLLPRDLSVYYDITFVRPEPYQYALFVAAAAGVLAGWKLRPRDRPRIALGVLFFGVTIGPFTKLLPFSANSLFNDRYMYLPSIGLIALLALALRAGLERGGRVRTGAFAAAVCALVALSVATWRRVEVWQSSESLWRSVLEVYPETAMAHYQLADAVLDRSGDAPRALALLADAARLDPHFAQAELRMGEILSNRGDFAAARQHFDRFLEQAPDEVGGRTIVGNHHARHGELARAVEHFEAALAIKPDAPRLLNNLGITLIRQRDFVRAETVLHRAAELAPDDPMIRANLGTLYLEQNRIRKARRAYREAAERGFEVGPGLARRLRD